MTAGRREWVGLAVIALPCLLYSMDLEVLYLATPSLARDLAPSGTELLWITDIYGFLLAGCLIPMGRLGDRIGRRRLLLVGAAAFGTVSILAALSTSPGMLIAMRALLGVAAATLAPSTLSLISNMFTDPRERTFAISVWVTSFSAGAALGPLAGGLLLRFYWWGSVFLIAVPIMAVLLVVGPRLLPEFRDPVAARLDAASAAMSLLAVLGVIYGLKDVAQHGVRWQAIAPVVAGAGIGLAFARRQRRLVDPLIDLGLFRRAPFAAAMGANVLSLAATFGVFLLIAQYLQLVLGQSPLVAGLWTLPSAGAFIAGSLAVPALVARLRPGRIATTGLAVAAVGLVVLGQAGSSSGLAAVVAGSVILAVGVSPVVTLGTDLIVGSVPPERAGMASGLSETGTELGGALGIALLGSIGVAVYRRALPDSLPGLDAGQATTARATLANATEVAAGLPDRTAGTLLEAAREAFTRGFQIAAFAGAAVLLVTSAMVARALWRGGEAADPEPEQPDPALRGGPR